MGGPSAAGQGGSVVCPNCGNASTAGLLFCAIVGGPLPLAPALMNGQTHYASQGGIVTVPPAVNAARRHPSSRAITAIVIAVVIVALAAVGVFLAFVFAAVQPTYTRSNQQAGT